MLQPLEQMAFDMHYKHVLVCLLTKDVKITPNLNPLYMNKVM
jgi:hypothetical protein